MELAVGVCGVITGTTLGLKIFDKLDKKSLRRVISVLMTATGIMMVIKGLR